MARPGSDRSIDTAPPSPRAQRLHRVARWSDERTGLASLARANLRKIFPDHWSFMLGEIALWSFVVLLVTGVLLTLWFKPSMSEVTYQGSYDLLRGTTMSEAYRSTLRLSFDVQGGLLLRQMHHWAAMFFIGGMMLHLVRVFFTGAFRKPRELNWVVGSLMLLLGTLEGFTGYSLPDDLLSGTGVRISYSFFEAIPVVGTYLAFLAWGGEYPGDDIVSRLYSVHVLLIPGLLLGLISVHMILLVYQKHTQWPGPGRTEDNVVGFPLLPMYLAKSSGFFFIVFGTIATAGGLLTINPVWKYGPYDPSKVTAGSQPDWYMGFPDGALRLMPGLETHLWGHTIAWNVIVPIFVIAPGLFTIVLMLPFLHNWLTRDRREHHLLQRPRDAPNRTATMVALMTWYLVMFVAGGNDIIAIQFYLSIEQIIWFLRIAFFVAPIAAFIVTQRWCVALQRKDNERLKHGLETGIISRAPSGRYSERHAPIPLERAYRLGLREAASPAQHSAETADGLPAPRRAERLRRSLVAQQDVVRQDPPPWPEVEAGRRAAPHDGEPAADGHQFDGREDLGRAPLRGKPRS